MINRRDLVLSALSASAVGLIGFSTSAEAGDLPGVLSNARDQFINYIYSIANATGMAPTQQLVLNNLILPLDIDASTPYFNDELFRLYADSTFTGGIQELQQSTPAGQAARFSFQYKVLVESAGYAIDQNHPEIANTLTELNAQLDAATTALNKKLSDLDLAWATLAAARGLELGTNNYLLQQITWQGQVHYRDQISSYSKNITKIVNQLNQTRRRVYSPSERAVLDNLEFLTDAYDMARPWFAQVEVEQKQAGSPITAIMLGDAHTLNPGMFDIGPLIIPQGNLASFLSAPAGTHGFDTGKQSYQLSQGARSWAASGGVSFAAYSLGGSGGGSSSFSEEVKTLNSIELNFDNIAEYKIARGGWLQPGVLKDPVIQKLLKGRPEFDSLRYVAISLILVRGTTMTLKFSKSVNSSNWSQSSFAASGGASFMGFGLSVGGGSSSSNYTVNNNADWTTVTFKDGPSVVRVIGVRVEPFIPNETAISTLSSDSDLALLNEKFKETSDKYQNNKIPYLEFQQAKASALNAELAKGR